MGRKHKADRRKRQISVSFLSACVCACCLLQQFHNPPSASQQLAGCPAPFHSHMSGSGTTTGKGLHCFHSQVLSPASLRIDLVIIINNRGSSRDKPPAFQNGRFCLCDGAARTDKLGVYLRGFLFWTKVCSSLRETAADGRMGLSESAISY